MSLYQKYRPKNFDEVVGQTFVTTSLKNALVKDNLAHAYLFCGPRGTGKTSIARIFSKSLNCLNLSLAGNPCGACEHCLALANETFFDVIELDAASNTGVDNIRELIEQMRFPPSSGKYKIYIIDEVHMLSSGAFNALLKTLEEPPVHGKFILATTEIHKIPDTIISRTLRYDFRRITHEQIVGRLNYIAEQEGIIADEKSFDVIARNAKGGLRDAIGLLEQYASGGEISFAALQDYLGMMDEHFLSNFLQHIFQKDNSTTEEDLHFLQERSIDIFHLIEQLLYAARNMLVEAKTKEEKIFLLHFFDAAEDLLVRLRYVPDTFISFEMMIYALLTTGESISRQDNSFQYTPDIPASPKKELKTETPKVEVKAAQKIEIIEEIVKPAIQIEEKEEIKKEENKVQIEEKIEQRVEIKSSIELAAFGKNELLKLAGHFGKIKGLSFVGTTLKMASCREEEGILCFGFSSQFFVDKMSAAEVRVSIADALATLFGIHAPFRFALDSSGHSRNNALAQEAKNIF